MIVAQRVGRLFWMQDYSPDASGISCFRGVPDFCVSGGWIHSNGVRRTTR